MDSKKLAIFCLLCHIFVTGCVSRSIETLLLEKVSKTSPSHREILTGMDIEKSAAYGKLSKKALFIGLFPLYLAEMANFIEQRGYIKAADNLPKSKILSREDDEETVQKMVEDPNPVRRALGLEIMDSYEKPDKREVSNLLTDDDPYIQLIALRNLKHNSSSYAFNIRLLGDSDEIVRIEALRSLENFKDKKILQYLRRTLKDTSSVVRAETIRILANLGFEESIPYLWPMLEDEQEFVRKEAMDALVKLTGYTGEYPYYANYEERVNASNSWQQWWEQKVKNPSPQKK